METINVEPLINNDTLCRIEAMVTSLGALKQRAVAVAMKISGRIPVNDLSRETQKSFLLCFLDLQRLEKLFEHAERSLSGVAMLLHNKSNHADSSEGDLLQNLADMAAELCASVTQQFGVAADVVLEAILGDVPEQLATIEQIVVRCETNITVVDSQESAAV